MKTMNFLMALLSIATAFILSVGYIDAAPYQELEPRKGYVPVYIRYGETPLSEIHPKLAEAFHEDENENVHLDKIESANLTESKNESSNDSTQMEANNSESSSTSERTDDKDSDIASFDVIKGKHDDSNDDSKN